MAIKLFSHTEFLDSVSKICHFLAEKYNLSLYLNERVVDECYLLAEHTLKGFRHRKRNSSGGKAGAAFCYWIKKLKPIAHQEDSPKQNDAVNEMCAVLMGLAIIRTEDINPHFLSDFSGTLRIHTHSPHSLALLFESLEGRAEIITT